MAALNARGLMRAGDAMTAASVIGSTFDGRIVSETRIDDRAAIVPAIRGSAWITGVTQVLVDDTDPFPQGYVVADTWPGELGTSPARQG
jgi:proline racemase